MKNWLYEKYKNLTFFQGVALTVCLSSLISIAATNIPGFFVFSAGTPISSSEINANFEKLAGTIVLQATYSTGYSVTQTSFSSPPECPTCVIYFKKLFFNSIALSDINLKTTTDTHSSSGSFNSTFHYYQVPANGWYEIRLIGDAVTSIANEVCQITNCSVNVSNNVNVAVADSASNAAAKYNNFSFLNGIWFSNDVRDSNSDGTFDSYSTSPGYPPESKKYYLKAGQVVFLKAEASYQLNSATADISAGLNSAELTIIKL